MQDFLNKTDESAFELSGELTIYNAEALKKSLAPVFDLADARLSVDCTGIKEIDGAGLQVLLVCRNHSMANGGELLLTNVPEVMQQLFDVVGAE
ncbi:MAG: Anti-anti-sigma regulatory factor (antagonist of anti-sigma factor) [Marinobacter excellens HL-55]|uniref:Anti-anti-sigma regulatory factor (Antagonist of anti-sigma factor) n=1 Tax=Marinobacter excellens HL-55 TaxID=1305731 RepID=A0A0P7Z8S1_9GAMM|nr:MAG: Anti-anti-sigma regulatory factor (antagonist of anti-sigma factor) [Marinobacter excellens HL-55]